MFSTTHCLYCAAKAMLFDKRRKLPNNPKEALLISMGAIYGEEHGEKLDVLDDHYSSEFKKEPDFRKWNEAAQADAKESSDDSFLALDAELVLDYQDVAQGGLAAYWEIFDSMHARETLCWLREEGTQGYYQFLLNYFRQHGLITVGNLELFLEMDSSKGGEKREIKQINSEIEWAREVDVSLGAIGVLAWDMARYVNVTRLCFLAGYLSDEECWTEIGKLESKCIGVFWSWTQFSASFHAGRRFWTGQIEDEHAKSLEAASGRLLKHCLSPWSFYEWPQAQMVSP